MKLRIFIIGLLALCSFRVAASENYFRPGTVWTVKVFNDAIPATYIVYNAILDEITFEGEKVLPFVEYRDEAPEPVTLRYLRTDGEKVYWRSTNPKYPNWYLLYDFGLQVGEEAVVYLDRGKGKADPFTLKCLRYDFYSNDDPLKGPLMRLQVLKYGVANGDEDRDCSSDEQCQGDWIIGIGHRGGAGSILSPFLWGWIGGGQETICVESPKGDVVYGDPTAGIKTTSDYNKPAVKASVYNLQGIRVADTVDNLPAGLYIFDGKKVAITK